MAAHYFFSSSAGRVGAGRGGHPESWYRKAVQPLRKNSGRFRGGSLRRFPHGKRACWATICEMVAERHDHAQKSSQETRDGGLFPLHEEISGKGAILGLEWAFDDRRLKRPAFERKRPKLAFLRKNEPSARNTTPRTDIIPFSGLPCRQCGSLVYSRDVGCLDSPGDFGDEARRHPCTFVPLAAVQA